MRNNREFDNLSKEIEFQGLEIEFSEKKIREFGEAINRKKEEIAELTERLESGKALICSKAGRTGTDHFRNQAGRRETARKSKETGGEYRTAPLDCFQTYPQGGT